MVSIVLSEPNVVQRCRFDSAGPLHTRETLPRVCKSSWLKAELRLQASHTNLEGQGLDACLASLNDLLHPPGKGVRKEEDKKIITSIFFRHVKPAKLFPDPSFLKLN